MAVGQRRPKDVIHHSDQGSQYTSLAFGKRCKEAGVRPSMGSVGDAYDNAMCESFFATLECELLDRRRFASQAEARMACFSFIEGWYNPVRLHSALSYRSPWPTKQRRRRPQQNPDHPSSPTLHENGAASTYDRNQGYAVGREPNGAPHAWVVEPEGWFMGEVRLNELGLRDARVRVAVGLYDPAKLGIGLGREAVRLVLLHARTYQAV